MDGDHEMNGDQGGFRGRGKGRGGRGGPPRGGRGGRGGPPEDRGGPPRQNRGPEDRVFDRLQALSGQPTHELPDKEKEVKKFTNHCRLFVGNIPNDIKQDEFEDLFKEFGETNEVFVNPEKAFGFIKLDFRGNAEKAKTALDGKVLKNRTLKVRFAAHGAALRLKNLSPWVSNELLERAFNVFGETEKAVHIVDAKGKPTGEGIVEFVSKPAANMALKMCTEGCFFLTTSPKPVIVELLTEEDNDEGYPEKTVPKRNQEFMKEREMGPRFAPPGSFEFEYGQSWKALYELDRQKKEALDAEMRYEKEKLEEQMEYAKFEHETTLLREQLRQRELQRENAVRDQEFRIQQREEQRKREEERFRRQHEEMMTTIRGREDNMKMRAQENAIFMETHGGGAGLPPRGGGDDTRNSDGAFYQQNNWNDRDGGNGRGPPDPKSLMDKFSSAANGSFNPQDEFHAAGGEREAIWAGGRGGPGEDYDNPNKRRRWQ